jgi:hypothetical protein
MVSKRRRSGGAAMGAAAAGCSPFGLFLTFAVIWLIIQYWWVLLIALGVVALTVALIRSARAPAPPVTPRPPKPLRAPEPKPLVSDDLAEQMRITKRVRHVRAMQEWDYEWIRLAYPEKNSRELSEFANAHFARGRSFGVNYADPSVPRISGPKTEERFP